MEGKGPLKSGAAWKNLEAFFAANKDNINILDLFNKGDDTKFFNVNA